MARKVERNPPASRPQEGRDDVLVMHPDITLTIAGRAITVREYGFVAGLKVRQYMKPFTDGLVESYQRGEALFDDVLLLVAEHWDIVERAVAESASLDVEWMQSLGNADGELLTQAWWKVCGPFFIRPIVRRVVERLQVAQRGRAAGPTSTSTSSAPALATPNASADTPSGSSDSSTND
jgi:hypothetical protein